MESLREVDRFGAAMVYKMGAGRLSIKATLFGLGYNGPGLNIAMGFGTLWAVGG